MNPTEHPLGQPIRRVAEDVRTYLERDYDLEPLLLAANAELRRLNAIVIGAHDSDAAADYRTALSALKRDLFKSLRGPFVDSVMDVIAVHVEGVASPPIQGSPRA